MAGSNSAQPALCIHMEHASLIPLHPPTPCSPVDRTRLPSPPWRSLLFLSPSPPCLLHLPVLQCHSVCSPSSLPLTVHFPPCLTPHQSLSILLSFSSCIPCRLRHFLPDANQDSESELKAQPDIKMGTLVGQLLPLLK